MQIIKKFFRLLICIICIGTLFASSYAADNLPNGEVGEYGNWVNKTNIEAFNQNLSKDAIAYQNQFQSYISTSDFVPVEAKVGLVFMKALSAIDYVLQTSLVRFTIVFLIIAYMFWIGLEAYKMIRESTNYKTVFFDIFKKGFIIAIWLLVLNYGPAKIFGIIISPILGVGIYLSNFILNTIADTYHINIPDTCATIHQYVDANAGQLLVDSDTAANIMCLPARLSVYFYHAVGEALQWVLYGFKHSIVAILVGIYCVFIFIKCILKYAFMTLGIVADLFLRLLMLPFTALAEAMPSSSEKNIAGQVFNGFLKMFNTQKLSDIINAFINTAVYFVSLSVVIGICAALLTNIISVNANGTYNVSSAMTTLLCGVIIAYLANKTDEFAKKLGGSIDNSFGKQLEDTTKTLFNSVKNTGSKVFKAISKK